MITASSQSDPAGGHRVAARGVHRTVATAIADTEARGEVHRLAEEQAALRRVATVVAEGGRDLPPSDAEERLAEFAELVDTAIANADSRDQPITSRARAQRR
jgi:hypothetical protein